MSISTLMNLSTGGKVVGGSISSKFKIFTISLQKETVKILSGQNKAISLNLPAPTIYRYCEFHISFQLDLSVL